MAFIRNLVIMTFDKSDSKKAKDELLKVYSSQGYQQISSIKLTGVSDIEEVMLQGNIKYGTFEKSNILTKKDNLFNFNPAGGLK